MNSEVIKVLIADDHALIRQGLKSIIQFENDLNVVGEAENGEIVLNMLNRYDTDVLLLDINMPLINGIKVLEQTKKLNNAVKVIVLTVEDDRRVIHEAIDIGADGYLLKDSVGTEIVDAIRTVFSGEKYIDKSLVSTLFSDIKSKDEREKNILDVLSKREVEVLLKISKGLSNKEIGEQLFLSEKTIKNYVTKIFRKIDAPDRVHAAIIAFKSSIEEHYKSKYNQEE